MRSHTHLLVRAREWEHKEHDSSFLLRGIDLEEAEHWLTHSSPRKTNQQLCIESIKKFSYDLWGDTVNTANRMESQALAGKIQVTAATYERLREQYLFKERGLIQVKGKGEMMTYFLIGTNNSLALRDFPMKKCPTL